MKEFESQLNKMKETAKLSDKERAFHRAEILKFMELKASSRHKRVPSPFYPFYFWSFFRSHMALSALAVVLVAVTSISAAAQGTLPGDYLYAWELRITEPMQEFFAVTSEQQAKFAVKLVNKRLREFSAVSLQKKLDPETTKDIHGRLAAQIADAHEEIQGLVEESDISGAAGAANDLEAVLSAHEVILEKVAEKNPDAAALSGDIDAGRETTQALITGIVETAGAGVASAPAEISMFKVQSEPETKPEETKPDADIREKELNQSLEDQREKTARLTEELSLKRSGFTETLQENLDIVSTEEIEAELSLARDFIGSAEKEITAGNMKSALELYGQAYQILSKLEYLIEADQNLKAPAPEEPLREPDAAQNSTEEPAPPETKLIEALPQ